MTARSAQLPLLNENDYQRFRVPPDLASFGGLSTTSGLLPLQRLDLRGQIVGLVYQLRLVQRFYNAFAQPLEATYIFPLPARAAVTSFVMQTQQRRVKGCLEERGKARQQYQQAIAQGKQAALAEEDRSEVFTIKVGNIPPLEYVDIELEFSGPLSWSDGQSMFRFPLVVAPRYMPGSPLPGDSVGSGTAADSDAVPDASRISPPVLLAGYPNPVQLSLSLQIDSCGLGSEPPWVSLPELQLTCEGQSQQLSLLPTANRIDRDLIVRFPRPSASIQTSLQVSQGSDGRDYFLLNLIPDGLHQRGPAVPRHVVALLDRSGSMKGWKMACARRAVGRLIDSLGEQDSFQVLNFDDRVEPLDPARPRLLPANDRERFLALEKLSTVEARGGTEILPALQAGVHRFHSCSGERYLLLITDGQVGNESQLLEWVRSNSVGIRIFTVGIDSAVNVGLLERLAQMSGGHCTLVHSEQDLDREMSSLRRRINPPLLQRVALRCPEQAEMSPPEVDLFEGLCARQLGVLSGPCPGVVEVVGYGRQGEVFQQQVAVTRRRPSSLEQSLWARERVLELEYGFVAGWSQPQYQPAAIAKFALEHGVLCRFTAFVAIDEHSSVVGPLHQVTQAVSQPAGWGASEPAMARPFMARSSSPMRSMASPPISQSCAAPMADAFAAPSPASDPFAADPFASSGDPFAASADPFAAPSDPFASPIDPFASSADPFAASADPFGAAADPFGAADPFAVRAQSDPFAEAAKAPALNQGWVQQHAPNPLEQLVHKLGGAQSRQDWLALLDELLETLIRQGWRLSQLELLLSFRTALMLRPSLPQVEEAGLWRQQISRLLGQSPPSRQESFWR